MTGLMRLVAAALISTISATSAFAQAAISEPAAFQAMYPNRDVLNAGAPIGYVADNAYAGMGLILRAALSLLRPRNGHLSRP